MSEQKSKPSELEKQNPTTNPSMEDAAVDLFLEKVVFFATSIMLSDAAHSDPPVSESEETGNAGQGKEVNIHG